MPANRRNEDADSSAVNASSEVTTTAKGSNTYGTLNQHPHASSTSQAGSSSEESSTKIPFRVGVAEDRNKRWRRTMEDAHAFVYDFGSVRGQGFFGVFDGHAGKHAAEWCGQHFHESLLDSLIKGSSEPVPDLFNQTYHSVDEKLSILADEQGTSSGCTAVTVFLRLEDEDGNPVAHANTGGIDKNIRPIVKTGGVAATSEEDLAKTESSLSEGTSEKSSSGKGLLNNIARKLKSNPHDEEPNTNGNEKGNSSIQADMGEDGLMQVQGKEVKRVLYTANVGDARAVLCRGGKAVRLTYDHKGSDSQEAKRITDAGGFVMNNRVNGVLAVTRSLGDAAMKEFVVGSPYTTETTLGDDDSFLIVACDGLWDVTDDQDAVDLIANEQDPQEAAAKLLQHALSNFSTDNTSVMVIRFRLDVASVKSAEDSSTTVESTAT